jgi:hypothetical protein
MASSKRKEEIIEIKEAIIILRADGIMQVTYRKGVVIDVSLQAKIYELFEKICKGTKRPFLFSAFDNVSVTPEARNNAVEMEHLFPGSATAVLANSLAYKLIANFYLKVNRPKTPFKVFSDETKAVEWLLGFIEK